MFVVGWAGPLLQEGAVALKMYANGSQAWLTQVSMRGLGYRIAVDGENNAYIFGGDDVAQVQANGSHGWSFDFDIRDVPSRGIAVHEQGDVFVTRYLDDGVSSREQQICKINASRDSNSTVEASSASRAEAPQILVAVTGVLLAMVLNPFHTQEMEQP